MYFSAVRVQVGVRVVGAWPGSLTSHNGVAFQFHEYQGRRLWFGERASVSRERDRENGKGGCENNLRLRLASRGTPPRCIVQKLCLPGVGFREASECNLTIHVQLRRGRTWCLLRFESHHSNLIGAVALWDTQGMSSMCCAEKPRRGNRFCRPPFGGPL